MDIGIGALLFGAGSVSSQKLGIDLKLGSAAAAAIATDCPRWIESAKLVKLEWRPPQWPVTGGLSSAISAEWRVNMSHPHLHPGSEGPVRYRRHNGTRLRGARAAAARGSRG